MPKPIIQNGTKIRLSITDSKDQTLGRQTDHFRLQLVPHKVVILHPSFGCPAIAMSGTKIVLFILTDNEFQTLYDTDPNQEKRPRVKAVINTMLKILPWSHGKKIKDVPLYSDTAKAIANIGCFPLGDITANPGGQVKDKDGNLFALLRSSALEAYKSDYRVTALFQLELEIGAMAVPPKIEAEKNSSLYEAAWLLPDPDRPNDVHRYAELQDHKTQHFLRSNGLNNPAAGPVNGYRIDDGDSFSFAKDEGRAVRNRHPILVTHKKTLNVGHLTDVHVSSRQMAFRQSTARVLQETVQDKPAKYGRDIKPGEASPELGNLVTVAYETVKNLLNQMGNDPSIDALILTGDLIDYNRNFDPASLSDWQEHFALPGNLWEAMHRDHHRNDKASPHYIDDLIVYSLLDDFYKKGKPIFMVSGNHEAYALPYGISPRVIKPNPLTPAGAVRANEGIPADHNLTIYEALLMYGPEYHVFQEAWNFKKDRLPWFYTVFTPFSDYIVQHGDQCFVGLGWGDDEDLLNLGGGRLPRATETLTPAQENLVKQATLIGADGERVLFTHFTLASYSPEIPLRREGSINCNNHVKDYSDFEQGSFKKNRRALYTLIHENKFKITLSGHSHRAALYEPSFDASWVRATLRTLGHEIEHAQDMDIPFQGKTPMVVSGCGGPIAVQNHYEPPKPNAWKKQDHLKGYGMDWPSGTRIKLDGGLKIKRVLPQVDHVKGVQPRFAVALDFFDLLEERVFTKFESETNDGSFSVEINAHLPAVRFIEGMALVARLGKDWITFPITVTGPNTQQLLATMSAADTRRLRKEMLDESKQPIVFLSTVFNHALKGVTGYTQYNFDSPWLMRVDVSPRTMPKGYGALRKGVPVGGYTIKRHGKHGEIPDFKWYRKNFGKLYPYGRELPKSATKGE